jgi:hypothetical protein
VFRAPLVVGGVVYAVTSAGDLVTLALGGCGAATCSPIASYHVADDAGGPSSSSPVYDGGRIFLGTPAGEVVALGLPPAPS